MADLQSTIAVNADASGVESGLAAGKRSILDFASTVEQGATRANTSMDGMGAGAKKASGNVERETARISRAIERQIAVMEAGGKQGAAYWESIAKQRGVDTAHIDNLINKLRLLEQQQSSGTKAMSDMGMSAAATAAAMRQVPAQVQDIIVSLQGGQQPMTVFLQQGSHLATSFGGMGAAAKALGTYLLGLVTPFTALAAVGATVALAWYQGSKEAENYNKALILSGNAAGQTAGQLQAVADAIGATGRARGAAVDALTEIASQGLAAGSNLQRFAEVAIDMERATGQSVGKTVEHFADLGREPVKASEKLNEQFRHLTAATYEQIRALEAQGRSTEAARVAQEAFADSMARRASQVIDNAGLIEKAWHGITSAAKGAWAAMLNIGKADTVQDQLAAAQKELDNRMQRGPLNSMPWAQQAWEKGNEELKKRIAHLNETARAQQQAAQSEAARQEQDKAGIQWIQAGERYLSQRAKMERELAQARDLGTRAGRSQAEIEQRLNAIRASYEKSSGGARTSAAPGENEVARIRAMIQQEERYTLALRERGIEASKLTAGEKLVLQIQQQLETGIKGVARSNKEAALAEAQRLVVAEQARLAEEKRAKAIDKARQDNERLVADTYKTAEGLQRQAQELDAANAVWGKGKVAIEEYRLQQAQEMLAMAEASDRFVPEYVEALRAVVNARRQLTESTRDAEFKALNEGLQQWASQARERQSLYRDEARLAGMTALERAKITAERQVELKLAKEIEKINKSGLSDAQKQVLISEATAAAAVEKSAEVAKVVQEDWQRTADQVNQSLTDALMRGFESGKDFGKNFADTLKNMFRTLVLRPIVNFVVQPVGNAITAVINGFLGGGGQGGNIWGNLLSGVSSGQSMYNAIGQIGSLFGWGGTSGAAAGSLSMANAVGALGGDSLGAFIGLNNSWGAGMSAWGGLAAGVATVAAPLIVGALVERNARDRAGGAAYASSNWREDPLATVAAGSTSWHPGSSSLPDREALIAEMVDRGVNTREFFGQFGSDDRALYHYWLMSQPGPQGMDAFNMRQLDPQTLRATYGDFYRGQGYVDPQALGWWDNKGYDLTAIDPEVVAASRRIAESVVAPLTEVARVLGLNDDLRATVGFANRGGGALWGAMSVEQGGRLLHQMDRGDYANSQDYTRAVYTGAVDALAQLDLPGWAREQVSGARAQLDALSGDQVGEQAASIYQQTAAAITAALKALDVLGRAMPAFAALTDQATTALISASGGVDSFVARMQAFQANYLTEEERRSAALSALQQEFDALGVAMPTTRAGMRALVEQSLGMGEASAQTTARLLELSAAFAELHPATDAAIAGVMDASAAFQGASQLGDIIREGLLGNITAADLGGQMADVVIGGIYNAVAGGFANQITQIMVQGVVNPVIQAAITGASMSEAVSQAAIDKMVADATAVVQAMGAVLNNPGFREAMSQIERAMLNLAPAIAAPQPYYNSHAARQQQADQAAQAAQRAAEERQRQAQRDAEEAARQQQQRAQERLGLMRQLLEAEGHTQALREMELAQLDSSNRALQERIWALQDATEAEARHAAALEDAQNFLASFGRDIQSFIFNTRLAQASGAQAYQISAAQFSAQMVLARGGDRDALGGITQYADALIQSIRADAVSTEEANLRIGRVLGQLGELPRQVSAEQLIVDAVQDMKNTLSGVLVSKFDQLDVNLDGLLTADELRASGLASNAQIAALIARVDVNGDGMISRTEAVRAATDLVRLRTEAVNTSVAGVRGAVDVNTNTTSSWSQSLNTNIVGGNATTSQQLGLVHNRVGDVDSSVQTSNNRLLHGGYSLADWSQLTYLMASNINTSLFHVSTGRDSFMVRSRNQGQGEWAMFAKGGVFTNQVVNSPTAFRMGLMGEAGPEAIMPLVRLPGGDLGVRALGGSMQELVAAVAALQVSVERLREDQQAQASALVALERQSGAVSVRALRLMESWDRDGTPVPRGAVTTREAEA